MRATELLVSRLDGTLSASDGLPLVASTSTELEITPGEAGIDVVPRRVPHHADVRTPYRRRRAADEAIQAGTVILGPSRERLVHESVEVSAGEREQQAAPVLDRPGCNSTVKSIPDVLCVPRLMVGADDVAAAAAATACPEFGRDGWLQNTPVVMHWFSCPVPKDDADLVLDLDVPVVDRRAEALEVRRLVKHQADRVASRLFRRQVRVAALQVVVLAGRTVRTGLP